jgi:hypothetical protein
MNNKTTLKIIVLLMSLAMLFFVSTALGRAQLRGTAKASSGLKYGALAGRVTSNTNPVTGVSIAVTAGRIARGQRELSVDADGRYSFAGLSPGNYVVTLRGGSVYGQQRRRVAIHAGLTTALDFSVLPRSAPPPR